MSLKIGSLFSGYGGLDMGVSAEAAAARRAYDEKNREAAA